MCGNLIERIGHMWKSVDNFVMRCSGRLSVLNRFLLKRSKSGELKVLVRTTIVTIVMGDFDFNGRVGLAGSVLRRFRWQ